MNPRPLTPVRQFFGDLLGQPPADLVFRLTLLTLLLHGSSDRWLDVPLQVVCGLALVSRTHHRSPVTWLLVAVFVWGINATDWLWIDNHKFLMSYWVLACALAATATDADPVLRWNGRLLAGLCFAFATLWKLVGGQYLNGEFFTYTLLLDDRMEFLAHHLGGVSPADLAQARALENTLALVPGDTVRATLPGGPRLHAVALLLSWWTIAIEAAITALFLGGTAFCRRWRDAALLAFVASTYVLVPVLGFGYILVILGLASCRAEQPRCRAAYLIALVILQLGRLPWEELFG